MYKLENIPSIAMSLNSFERDCAITVALKIVDNSCKMDAYEKSIFMALFDSLKSQETEFFHPGVFETIAETKKSPTAQLYAEVKKLRESAMDMISRPKMKAFKASIREKLLN